MHNYADTGMNTPLADSTLPGSTPGSEQYPARDEKSGDTIHTLKKITVKASSRKKLPRLNMQPAKVFSGEDVQIAAGVAGDVCRYIATMPSVVSSLSENFDNALYVRGGRPSEVLFVVDGIEFENINHFSQANGSGGPVGFINSEYVKDVSFFAGNTPVSYPPRLSSVIAVDMQNGSFTDRSFSLGCKLTGGMFSAEGPLFSGNGSYLLSTRYIDFRSLERLVGDYGIPRLGDLLVRGTWLRNETTDLSVTGLLAYNDYSFNYAIQEHDDVSGKAFDNALCESDEIVQGGFGIRLKKKTEGARHLFNASVSFRRGITGDSLHDFDTPFFVERYRKNPVREDHDKRYRGLFTSNSTLELSETMSLQFGTRLLGKRYDFFNGDYQHYQGQFVFCHNGIPVETVRNEECSIRSMQLDGMEAGGHGEFSAEFGAVTATLGLRSDYYHLLHDITFSPRLTSGIRFGENASLTLGASVQHQFPTEMPTLFFYFFSFFSEISDSKATKATKDFLEDMEPLRCYQTVLTYEQLLTSWMHVRSDCYFKWYDREYHFISPKVQEVLYHDDDQQWKLKEQNGKRRAYGIEVLLDNPAPERFTWSIGASLFDVKNRYNNGVWYDDWTNVRFTGSLSLGMKLFSGHQLSFGLLGNGGRPYCPEIIVQDCIGRKSCVYDPEQDYYSCRHERYITVHVRYAFQQKISRFTTEFSVEVLNFLNNQPTLEYRFNGNDFYNVKPFGIVPVLGVQVEW
jgi:hypothetical protein